MCVHAVSGPLWGFTERSSTINFIYSLQGNVARLALNERWVLVRPAWRSVLPAGDGKTWRRRRSRFSLASYRAVFAHACVSHL